ncbi:MAG: hypothetical protein HYT79_03720 [Elusimicrobia bacterium]|nr:hypothetical protein [Elusimicrobiota bacterium]
MYEGDHLAFTRAVLRLTGFTDLPSAIEQAGIWSNDPTILAEDFGDASDRGSRSGRDGSADSRRGEEPDESAPDADASVRLNAANNQPGDTDRTSHAAHVLNPGAQPGNAAGPNIPGVQRRDAPPPTAENLSNTFDQNQNRGRANLGTGADLGSSGGNASGTGSLYYATYYEYFQAHLKKMIGSTNEAGFFNTKISKPGEKAKKNQFTPQQFDRAIIACLPKMNDKHAPGASGEAPTLDDIDAYAREAIFQCAIGILKSANSAQVLAAVDDERPLLLPGIKPSKNRPQDTKAAQSQSKTKIPYRLRRELTAAVLAGLARAPSVPEPIAKKAKGWFYAETKVNVVLRRGDAALALLEKLGADDPKFAELFKKLKDHQGKYEEIMNNPDPKKRQALMGQWLTEQSRLLAQAGAAVEEFLKKNPDAVAKNDPILAAYAQTQAGAAAFYREWLMSKTAPPGEKFYPEDLGLDFLAKFTAPLGLDAGKIKHIMIDAVASVITGQGPQPLTGYRFYFMDGSSMFVSYGGTLTQVKSNKGQSVTVQEHQGKVHKYIVDPARKAVQAGVWSKDGSMLDVIETRKAGSVGTINGMKVIFGYGNTRTVNGKVVYYEQELTPQGGRKHWEKIDRTAREQVVIDDLGKGMRQVKRASLDEDGKAGEELTYFLDSEGRAIVRIVSFDKGLAKEGDLGIAVFGNEQQWLKGAAAQQIEINLTLLVLAEAYGISQEKLADTLAGEVVRLMKWDQNKKAALATAFLYRTGPWQHKNTGLSFFVPAGTKNLKFFVYGDKMEFRYSCSDCVKDDEAIARSYDPKQKIKTKLHNPISGLAIESAQFGVGKVVKDHALIAKQPVIFEEREYDESNSKPKPFPPEQQPMFAGINIENEYHANGTITQFDVRVKERESSTAIGGKITIYYMVYCYRMRDGSLVPTCGGRSGKPVEIETDSSFLRQGLSELSDIPVIKQVGDGVGFVANTAYRNLQAGVQRIMSTGIADTPGIDSGDRNATYDLCGLANQYRGNTFSRDMALREIARKDFFKKTITAGAYESCVDKKYNAGLSRDRMDDSDYDQRVHRPCKAYSNSDDGKIEHLKYYCTGKHVADVGGTAGALLGAFDDAGAIGANLVFFVPAISGTGAILGRAASFGKTIATGELVTTDAAAFGRIVQGTARAGQVYLYGGMTLSDVPDIGIGLLEGFTGDSLYKKLNGFLQAAGEIAGEKMVYGRAMPKKDGQGSNVFVSEAADKAEKLLNKKLNDEQRRAVEHAHRVGDNESGIDGNPAGIGNYTIVQIRKKNDSLHKNDLFSIQEARILMEGGAVGKHQAAGSGDPVVASRDEAVGAGVVARPPPPTLNTDTGPLDVRWTGKGDLVAKQGTSGGELVWVKDLSGKELPIEAELLPTQAAHKAAQGMEIIEAPWAREHLVEGEPRLVTEHLPRGGKIEAKELIDYYNTKTHQWELPPGLKLTREEWQAFRREYDKILEQGVAHGDLRQNLKMWKDNGQLKIGLIDWETGRLREKNLHEFDKARTNDIDVLNAMEVDFFGEQFSKRGEPADPVIQLSKDAWDTFSKGDENSRFLKDTVVNEDGTALLTVHEKPQFADSPVYTLDQVKPVLQKLFPEIKQPAAKNQVILPRMDQLIAKVKEVSGFHLSLAEAGRPESFVKNDRDFLRKIANEEWPFQDIHDLTVHIPKLLNPNIVNSKIYAEVAGYTLHWIEAAEKHPDLRIKNTMASLEGHAAVSIDLLAGGLDKEFAADHINGRPTVEVWRERFPQKIADLIRSFEKSPDGREKIARFLHEQNILGLEVARELGFAPQDRMFTFGVLIEKWANLDYLYSAISTGDGTIVLKGRRNPSHAELIHDLETVGFKVSFDGAAQAPRPQRRGAEQRAGDDGRPIYQDENTIAADKALTSLRAKYGRKEVLNYVQWIDPSKGRVILSDGPLANEFVAHFKARGFDRVQIGKYENADWAADVLKNDFPEGLSDQQRDAVEKAHREGRGEMGKDGVRPAGVGNYTLGQLYRKAKILYFEGDFTFSQIRRLMEHGVVGDAASVDGVLSPDVLKAYQQFTDRVGTQYEMFNITFLEFGNKLYAASPWKFHISVSPQHPAKMLDSVSGLLRNERVRHKIPTDHIALQRMLNPNDPGQRGKIITVYPKDRAHAVELMKKIDSLLAKDGFKNKDASLLPPENNLMPNSESGYLSYRYSIPKEGVTVNGKKIYDDRSIKNQHELVGETDLFKEVGPTAATPQPGKPQQQSKPVEQWPLKIKTPKGEEVKLTSEDWKHIVEGEKRGAGSGGPGHPEIGEFLQPRHILEAVGSKSSGQIQGDGTRVVYMPVAELGIGRQSVAYKDPVDGTSRTGAYLAVVYNPNAGRVLTAVFVDGPGRYQSRRMNNQNRKTVKF